MLTRTADSGGSHYLFQVPVLVDVFMPPIRERVNNRFVKKTLSLPAWLAAKADEDGVNCSKIFQNALIEYLDAKDARPVQ